MTHYVIGKINSSPRFTLEGSLEIAQLQVREGEVCFSQDQLPTAPYVINADGTALVSVELDAVEAKKRAWNAVRMKREAMLKANNWTWDERTSPLSLECQADWAAWAKTMNDFAIDYNSDPDAVVWPDMPAKVYPSK